MAAKQDPLLPPRTTTEQPLTGGWRHGGFGVGMASHLCHRCRGRRYERSLVKELLSQGGMRPVPPAQACGWRLVTHTFMQWCPWVWVRFRYIGDQHFIKIHTRRHAHSTRAHCTDPCPHAVRETIRRQVPLPQRRHHGTFGRVMSSVWWCVIGSLTVTETQFVQ